MANRNFGELEGVDEWSRRANQIMDEMLKRSYVEYRSERTWQPAVNLYEASGRYHVCVGVAGMERAEIDVECPDDRHVVIRGTRGMPRPAAAGELCIHMVEIDDGPFRRELELPEPVDVSAVEATYKKGFLWITLPKRKTD